MRQLFKRLSILIISLFVLFEIPNIKVFADDEFDFGIEQKVFTSENIPNMLSTDKLVFTKTPSVYLRDKYYWPEDREYTGIPAVAVVGDRIWVVWQTGDNGEPKPRNYLILTYSDDYGETWIDSFYTVEGFTLSDGEYTNMTIGTPLLHADNKGQLWLFFGFHNYKFSVLIRNPEASAKDIAYDDPAIIYQGATSASGLTVIQTEDGKEEWYFCTDQSFADATTIYYSSSTNKKKGWKTKGVAKTNIPAGDDKNKFHEAMLIEKNDGTFWMLKRIEKGYMGGIEQSFSYDRGKTWTAYEANLLEPFIGPGSKFAFVKLSSGNILLVNHATTESRSLLYAYLSTDDGETWPYKLALDLRDNVSYPDVYEVDGTIYCVWDKGRTIEQEIRLSIFTEKDIIAGSFVTEKSRDKLCVHKKSSLSDIKEITNEGYVNTITVPVGTSAESIIEMLPKTLTIVDDNENTITLEGSWNTSGYIKTKKGTYTVNFLATNYPANTQDVYNLLVVNVVVESSGNEEQSNNKGCTSSIDASVGLVMALVCLVFIKLKQKNRRGENL